MNTKHRWGMPTPASGTDGWATSVMGPAGDLAPEHFREAARAVADVMADYLRDVESYPVLPGVQPGELRAKLDGPAPEAPEPLGMILDDYRALVEPNITHWQHPGFLAYFASSGSAPGILAEMLMATVTANAMLWRTSPVATELEGVVVDWLRDGLGLPADYDGLLTDTASTSSLIALAAARETARPGAAADGLAGGPPLRIYASAEAHSSIDKAAMTLGLGRAGVQRIATDSEYRMDVTALEAAIADDRAAGGQPCAIVSTIGTTGPTSVDPTERLADICQREGLWLHVDAAYAGAAALIPESRPLFAGWERADSIVVNPHKWLFTPLDCSLLLSRRMEQLRASFSMVPEYLRTVGESTSGRDYNEYQPQLGRRFRALKLWFLMRAFGLSGLRERVRWHNEAALALAARVDAEADAERLAPVPFSTVCLRWRPERFHGRESEPAVAEVLNTLNERLMDTVNADGRVFLSHTRLSGRFTIRIAINHLRTEQRHLDACWQLIVEHGRRLAAELDPVPAAD
ncbi:MAG: pyridoxal-dependent decarboxylase [Chloroflexota bacterium]|nr:pyridoxal-dependent decarboxylase [Chloroflexota bacterium]